MSISPALSAEARFARLVAATAGHEGITVGAGGSGFGADALTVGGRIFAMVARDRLVLKLSAPRVAEIIAAGIGVSFDSGKGGLMKEWVALGAEASDEDWRSLADEARLFVAGTGRPVGGS